MLKEITLKIGGEAGQGLQSIGLILGKYFVRRGYYVFANQDNESRIHGGHNFFQLRIATYPVKTFTEPVDVLIALDRVTVNAHGPELSEGGMILSDAGNAGAVSTGNRGNNVWEMPLTHISIEHGGNKIFLNTAATAAILALTAQPIEPLEELLRENFGHKPEMMEKNIRVAKAAYDEAQRKKTVLELDPPPAQGQPRLFLNGHEALAMGALAVGCRFMAAYPMSPSTSIITFLAEQADRFGLVVEQAEDEIAAMNMVVGASYAGVRSMTATSGGGFCLMVEALGLAGMTETPAVVVNAQRPGPATGLPTRTEQADLEFVIHAAQGEFPRYVLAPRTAPEAFYLTARAFDLAERFQVPVIILTDQHLAESYMTTDPFDLTQIRTEQYVSRETRPGYQRYQYTGDGISPRVLPGTPGTTVALDSDEHDQDGHIIEDGPTRKRMMDKRMGKMRHMADLVRPPEIYGVSDPEWVLLGWGSTCEALREACRKLTDRGVKVQARLYSDLWPQTVEGTDPIPSGAKIVSVEGNYSGQLASLLTADGHRRADHLITRYDGRPISWGYIVDALQKLFEGGVTVA